MTDLLQPISELFTAAGPMVQLGSFVLCLLLALFFAFLFMRARSRVHRLRQELEEANSEVERLRDDSATAEEQWELEREKLAMKRCSRIVSRNIAVGNCSERCLLFNAWHGKTMNFAG